MYSVVTSPLRRFERWLHVPAPAERLAALRISIGGFVTIYLATTSREVSRLAQRPSAEFEPIGLARLLSAPLPEALLWLGFAALLVTGAAVTVGAAARITGPIFALLVLGWTSYHSSWGQLLHFENLMTLHLVIVSFAASADAWSLDTWHRRAGVGPQDRAEGPRYGWPLLLCVVTTVITYVIAGVAKIRYGGVEWMSGDNLRNHIASSATRLELLGAAPAPLAEFVVARPWILRPLAPISVGIELLAPLALIGRRWRNTWVAAAWLMHLGIYATMLVGFPSPLFLVAFAPMFRLEHVGGRVRTVMSSMQGERGRRRH